MSLLFIFFYLICVFAAIYNHWRYTIYRNKAESLQDLIKAQKRAEITYLSSLLLIEDNNKMRAKMHDRMYELSMKFEREYPISQEN